MCVCLYATDVIIILLGYQYNMEFPINGPSEIPLYMHV